MCHLSCEELLDFPDTRRDLVECFVIDLQKLLEQYSQQVSTFVLIVQLALSFTVMSNVLMI